MSKSGIQTVACRWPAKQLRHCLTVVSGATPDSGESSYWEGDIPWVTPEDVGALTGHILRDTRRKLTEEGHRNCGAKLVPAGSVVLTKRAPVGQLALLEREACCNQGCFLLVPNQTSESRYYYYWLQAHANWLQALSSGSTFVELSSDAIKALKVCSPAFADQDTIADYLDIETKRIDTLIAAKERLLMLMAEKRRALITHTITVGLRREAPLSDSGLTWLGHVPRHWRAERTRWLFTERDERTASGHEELLTVSHITGITRRADKDVNMFEAETTEGYKICRRGDLVINTMWAWMGAMGVSPIDGIVSPSYNVYTPCKQVTGGYLDALVRTQPFITEVTRYSKGVWSSRLRLYPEEFFQIHIPVPPLEEQQAIVTHIANETRKLDALRMATERTLRLLRERRSALIAAAVTGQLTIGGKQ